MVTVLWIDLGKNSCSVAGLDEAGEVVLRRRVPRDGLAALLEKLPGCVVAMEACCGVQGGDKPGHWSGGVVLTRAE